MTSAGLYKIVAAHVLYLALTGAGVWLCLRRQGVDPSIAGAIVCCLPALLGLVLVFTSTTDEEQYLMRLAAASLMTPMLLLFWSNSAGLPTSYMLGAGLFHMLCFAGSVVWMGAKTTQVPAVVGVPSVDATTLQSRLLSLAAIEGPLRVWSPAAHEVIVTFLYHSPGRSYRLLLNLDPATQQVRVRERVTGNKASPANDGEKSMRGFGESAFDPARPEAQAGWQIIAQVTPIRQAELTGTPLTWQGSTVAVPAKFAAALDERGVATLLCAVVTRSGWHWKPAFFGSK